jgi:hypothetical protein
MKNLKTKESHMNKKLLTLAVLGLLISTSSAFAGPAPAKSRVISGDDPLTAIQIQNDDYRRQLPLVRQHGPEAIGVNTSVPVTSVETEGTTDIDYLGQPYTEEGLGRPFTMEDLGRPYTEEDLGRPFTMEDLGTPVDVTQ